ncbi:hypothetical protein HYW18_02340 [Candidatus Uhrbacteria bacterium]|nr:hypothetical protein [Candidatus Uhrbacteria bacterium]
MDDTRSLERGRELNEVTRENEEPSALEHTVAEMVEAMQAERESARRDFEARKFTHVGVMQTLARRRQAPEAASIIETYQRKVAEISEDAKQQDKRLEEVLKQGEKKEGETKKVEGPKTLRETLEARLKHIETEIDAVPRFSPEQEALFAKHKAIRYELEQLDRTEDPTERAALEQELGKREAMRTEEDARLPKEEPPIVPIETHTSAPAPVSKENIVPATPEPEEIDEAKRARYDAAEKARELDAERLEYERTWGMANELTARLKSSDASERWVAETLLKDLAPKLDLASKLSKMESDLLNHGVVHRTELSARPPGERFRKEFDILVATHKKYGKDFEEAMLRDIAHTLMGSEAAGTTPPQESAPAKETENVPPTKEAIPDLPIDQLYRWLVSSQSMPGEEGENLFEILRQEMAKRLSTEEGMQREMKHAEKNGNQDILRVLEDHRAKHYPTLVV